MKKNAGEEAFQALVANVKDLYRQNDGNITIIEDEAHEAADRLIQFGRLALEIKCQQLVKRAEGND